ncbi:MAG TPA: helix-turn-helix domain-containing protein [Baekduia sp.]|uniref:helix-turn-helix domain-containing protein n=1 Tax=Baekduia sp. TaxID=2600305 RepID=UPI002D1C969C|nr:helix-turn-helix domain-containing protein [Baekduia sp.]HMJ34509.1 helix-turn-helix domain-containing protein [Baekduia sp.]
MPTPGSERPRRADAIRNRDAILVAARQVFARDGLDAPLDAVAREAGVGRATQHRHFPTRESLVRGIFDDNIELLDKIVREVEDPADAYVVGVLATTQMMAHDRGFVDVFQRPGAEDDLKVEVGDKWLKALAEPLRQAQAAGRVRPDLRLEDSLLLIQMIAGTVHVQTDRLDERATRAMVLLLEAIADAGARGTLDRRLVWPAELTKRSGG